jgi:hypothetical protein
VLDHTKLAQSSKSYPCRHILFRYDSSNPMTHDLLCIDELPGQQHDLANPAKSGQHGSWRLRHHRVSDTTYSLQFRCNANLLTLPTVYRNRHQRSRIDVAGLLSSLFTIVVHALDMSISTLSQQLRLQSVAARFLIPQQPMLHCRAKCSPSHTH